MQELHRGPGEVRYRVPGMNLVAEIAHEQYGSDYSCVIPPHLNLPPPPALTTLISFKHH